ncbi:MAG: hypothetical protein DMG68_17935 [Acidobacteria bacterium]|nr:MAG: hypothetical protein DMG68_17935 [Acidobacteriota bacterium]
MFLLGGEELEFDRVVMNFLYQLQCLVLGQLRMITRRLALPECHYEVLCGKTPALADRTFYFNHRRVAGKAEPAR